MRLVKNNDNPINEGKIISQIRSLGIDMINEAKSGHPGIVLGAAPIIYTLYANHLRFDRDNPNYFNRDRFIMSAGHGSALLYSTLFMAGFDLEIEDLKNFRQINSKTPGHPELGITPGVDMTTGPLGQGFATAVGVAIAEAHLEARYNKFSKNLFDFNTYVLCGDGDLEEGISYEAASLAGTLGLNKLIVLYDSNDTQLDSNTDIVFTEDIKMRFEACNWNYLKVIDGEDYLSISKAIDEAKKSTKPTIIEIKTKIGKFSKNEGKNIIHGGPLEKDDITNIKSKLNIRDVSFNVSNDTIEDFQDLITKRCNNISESFNEKLEKLNSDIKDEIMYLMSSNKKLDFKDLIYDEPENKQESPIITSGKVLNELSKLNQSIIGGSSDVFRATKTLIEKEDVFSPKNYKGRNIYFGVREHAMGAILNGLAITGYRPYGATFLAFSNYLMPAIRMGAMLKLPITYIFTHDSISLGEDGPTHQPIEQLAQLRAIPNLEVFRPCDANEVIGVYKTIMKKENSPAVISLSKNILPILEETNSNEVEKGGYIVRNNLRKLDGIIISSGEEVHIAIEIAKRLNIKGFDIRVVSMPSISIFLENTKDYIEEILPVGIRKIVIEASSKMPWNEIVFNKKYLITLDNYGKSGKKDDVYKEFGFDIDSLEEKVEDLLK